MYGEEHGQPGYVTGRETLKRIVTLGRSVADQIRPDGPVDRVGVLSDILVEYASHVMVKHGVFQCHAVNLAGAERLEIAADILHASIGRFGSGLERIIVADIDGLALDPPAVDFEHLV